MCIHVCLIINAFLFPEFAEVATNSSYRKHVNFLFSQLKLTTSQKLLAFLEEPDCNGTLWSELAVRPDTLAESPERAS